MHQTDLGVFLAGDVTLVPAPRAAPLQKNSLWPAQRICAALRGEGLGRDLVACLKRVTAVSRSALSQPGGRPAPLEHLASMAFDGKLVAPTKVTIVDDVITKGATLLAAASLIHDAFPAAEVRAFALVRTLGLQPDIEQILQPCTGVIRNFYGEAAREP